MDELVSIEKKSNTPAYRQIVQQVELAIRQGKLKPGDRLPPERELAAQLTIARGTVTRAYAELVRMSLIEVAQGRGSIVIARDPQDAAGRKEQAEGMIRRLIDSLARLRFGYPEMRAMVDLAITGQEEALAGLNVAAVDCNPETLGIFQRQIGLLSRISIRTYLLADLADDAAPAERLRDFDLLLTTSTHYADVCALVPTLVRRILRVTVAPSQETIVRLASVKQDARIGVLCESVKFLAIVRQRLEGMHVGGPVDALFWPRAPGALSDFARNRQVLILPPGGHGSPSREEARALLSFSERGGAVIVFDYQIEKGSLVYVEERVRDLLESRVESHGDAS